MTRFTAAVSFAFLVTLAASVGAAPWDRSGRLNREITRYDKGRVETVRGTVERLYENVPSHNANPDSVGFHVVLDTGKEKIDVHLGPRWYLTTLDGRIGKGDVVEVVGAAEEGHPSADGTPGLREIHAAEVRKGGVLILKLRDDDGKPLWSGY